MVTAESGDRVGCRELSCAVEAQGHDNAEVCIALFVIKAAQDKVATKTQLLARRHSPGTSMLG